MFSKYGEGTPKPLKLLASGDWVLRLRRRLQRSRFPKQSTLTRRYVKNGKVRFAGTAKLKGSQLYPNSFGRQAFLQCFMTVFFFYLSPSLYLSSFLSLSLPPSLSLSQQVIYVAVCCEIPGELCNSLSSFNMHLQDQPEAPYSMTPILPKPRAL